MLCDRTLCATLSATLLLSQGENLAQPRTQPNRSVLILRAEGYLNTCSSFSLSRPDSGVVCKFLVSASGYAQSRTPTLTYLAARSREFLIFSCSAMAAAGMFAAAGTVIMSNEPP